MNNPVSIPKLVLAYIIVMVFVTIYIRQGVNQLSLIQPTSLFLDVCAFTPTRYLVDLANIDMDMGYWVSPFCYAFIHFDWTHLFFNAVFFLIFATPIIRRVGNLKAFLFFTIASFFSAIIFLLPGFEEYVYLIGASGIVSACLGALLRLGIFPGNLKPAPEPFNNRKTCLIFLGVWLLLNGVPVIAPFMEASIAWQSHLAGFVFGFILYPLFEKKFKIEAEYGQA